MNIYKQLIGNPLFFKWVYHPSSEINTYWDTYLNINSEQATEILHFKSQFDQHLKIAGENLTAIERNALAEKIIRQLENIDQQKKSGLIFKSILKYAAVAILFFSVGSSLVYLYMESRQSTIIVDHSTLSANVQEPVLIIDNFDKIQLGGNKPELDYSNQGKIMLNKSEVIKESDECKTPQMNTLIIPYGSRSTITLSDGSKVWLNAGSRLIYPSKFVDKAREVFLVGEAFFEIEKNEEHPFIIKTIDIEVEVLGTRFNVSAYPEDYSVQTVLEVGSVEISCVNATFFDRGVNLVAGQMASFNKKTKETEVFDVKIEHYTLWTEGLLSFSNIDFSRIVKKLERYYNIRFNYNNPINGTIKISGKLDVTKGKEEVFEYLTKLTGLNIIKLNNWQYEIK